LGTRSTEGEVVRPTFAEIRARLAHLDQLDRGRKIFAADKHKYRLNPPLSPDRVEQIETLIGCPLPEQYRRFVTEFADGGAGPDYGVIPLELLLKPDQDRSWMSDLAQPFPSPTTVAEMREIGYSASGVLMVSEIGSGAHYCLVLAGPQRGFVWVQNPDAEWSPELSDDCHLPTYSEHTGTDPIFEAALASPDSLRLQFVDWYVKWLDDSLRSFASANR
jgi:hypothetical protein